MDVSFDLYKVFYFVCTFKSVTKAANHLCVSQPAVTKHIKNLESIFSCDLISRAPKGIELTSFGEKLFNEIKDPIEKLLNVNFNEKDIDYTMHISCGVSIARKYLLPALSNFNKKYPSLKIDVGNYYYRDSLQRLRDGKLDLIFLNLREGYNFGNDLIVKEFCQLTDIFAVSKKVYSSLPKKIKLLNLNNYDLIIKIGKSNSRNFIQKYFDKYGKKLEPKFELSNHWLIEDYIEKDLGIGIVAKEFVEEKLNAKKFIEIESDVKLPKRTIVYVTRKNTRYYTVINEFINDVKGLL